MHALRITRILILAVTVALMAGGGSINLVAASDHTRWNDTVNFEDALVQACAGFNVTGSYTADRSFLVVQNYDGSRFYERRDVTFAGVLGNATSGKSYAYDGQFTRISKPNLGKVIVSNLSLRFGVDTPGEFSISLKRVDFDLGDDPHAIVLALVPHVLRMDLCQLFGGSPGERKPGALDLVDLLHPSVAGMSNESRSASDDMTPWTKLDPCDTSPPGKPC